MKILSVTTAIPNEDAAWWRISNIAHILETNGHQVDFVHYCNKNVYNKLKNKTEYKNHKFVIASPITVPIKHLFYINNKKYDLIYGNTHSGVFCSILSRIMGIPLIYDMHGDIESEYKMQNTDKINITYYINVIKYKIIQFICLTFSDKIICGSRNMIDYLYNKKHIPYKKMLYVPNGVDTNFFKPIDNVNITKIKTNLGIMDNKLILGYIGGSHKWQGVDKLYEAIKKCNDKSIFFILIGTNADIKDTNLISIPSVPRIEVPKYYSICDILILPRPKDIVTETAAPTKFVEYLSMGKPVLTTLVGDAPKYVTENNCGIVVNENSVDDLLKGFNILKNMNKEDLIEMGKNSRLLAESKFNWAFVANDLLKWISYNDK